MSKDGTEKFDSKSTSESTSAREDLLNMLAKLMARRWLDLHRKKPDENTTKTKPKSKARLK